MEEINSKFNVTEGVINTQTWEVTVLYIALLRNHIPISLVYHVTPSIVATTRTCLTKTHQANALPSIKSRHEDNYQHQLWQNYKWRSLGLAAWNTAATAGTIIFTFTNMTNPDQPDSHAVCIQA